MNNTKASKRTKKRLVRPSPSESATSLPEGSIRIGNNKEMWVVVNNAKGVSRWTPIENVKLNGWQLLTLDYLSKNIGKPIVIYERTIEQDWPGTHDKMLEKYEFITDGHLQIGKKIINNWLQQNSRKMDKNKMNILLHRNPKQFHLGLGLETDNMWSNQLATNPYKHQAFVKYL